MASVLPSGTITEVEGEYSEVKYSPFHRIRGGNIVFSEDGCVARRAKGYDKAIIFSSQPIPVEGRFELVLCGMEQEWSGSLRFGLTTCNPNRISPPPASALELYGKEEYWTFSGSKIYNRSREKKSAFNMDDLKAGHSVGCAVTRKGKLEIFMNDVSMGPIWSRLPVDKPIWGFADLYGKATEVRSNTVEVAGLRPNTQPSLPSQLVNGVDSSSQQRSDPDSIQVDPAIHQKDKTIAALRQKLAAERHSNEDLQATIKGLRQKLDAEEQSSEGLHETVTGLRQEVDAKEQSLKDLNRTWEMANEEFMQMKDDHDQKMKRVDQELAETQRELKAVQSHIQQVLGFQKNVANGKVHGSMPGNLVETDSNSVFSMLHLLKEQVQELLTGESGATSDGYSGVGDTAYRLRTVSLPVATKEGVTVNSLLSRLKQRLSAEQQDEQDLRKKIKEKDKQIEVLEADISKYQDALARVEKEREPLEAIYEEKLLALYKELQSHMCFFQDSVAETQGELEEVQAEFAHLKRVVEANIKPSEHGQECTDECLQDDTAQCSSDGEGEGEEEGGSVIQEEDMTVVPEDASSGDQ